MEHNLKNKESQEEENTKESVNLAQDFEFILEILLLKGLYDVFNKLDSNSIYLNMNMIRNGLNQEIDKFVPELIKLTDKNLEISNKQVVEEFKNAFFGTPNNKWHKQIEKEFEKYITSKGIVLNGQRLETFFYNTCGQQVKKIVDGSITLQQAMKQSCHIMAKNGVSIVTYPQPNGHAIHRNIDVYVRQQLLYAQKESTQDTRYKYAEENGITTFEIDAHADARPSHQYWQGKRFDTTGKVYPTFDELSNGHGSLNDYGCLHRTYPVDPLSEPAYTAEELKNINTKPFMYNGVMYTGYEAKQKMRAYERDIRALGREKHLYQYLNERYELNIDTKPISTKYNIKYNQYKNFAEAYGTYPRKDRIRVHS